MLREAILSCITPDRSRLELLDAYLPWIKTDFVKEGRCKEIGEELMRQLRAIGGDENLPHVGRSSESRLESMRSGCQDAPEAAGDAGLMLSTQWWTHSTWSVDCRSNVGDSWGEESENRSEMHVFRWFVACAARI